MVVQQCEVTVVGGQFGLVDSHFLLVAKALGVTLGRFREFHNLRGAFKRRAIIEQAKGILIVQQRVTAEEAFGILTRASQASNRKLRDIAQAIVAKAEPDQP